MKKARLRATLQLLGIAVLAAAISAAPASAQNADDCRCVDRGGDAIENCPCFSVSPLRGLIQGLVPTVNGRPASGSRSTRSSAPETTPAAHGSRHSWTTVPLTRQGFTWVI